MATALSLEQFWHSPARQLLAYPSGDEDTLRRRWEELQTFGIESIYGQGSETLAGLEILGVGYCGVVLRVRHQGQARALKVLREPVPKASLQTEADMLLLANAVGVGPLYTAHSDNFLLMDYIGGPMVVDWLQASQSIGAIRSIVLQLIQQAHQLDQAGLDHGALRCITSHALVRAQTPILIDFSGASVERRVANVTTLVQGLFISTRISRLLLPLFPQVNKPDLVEYLRRYKQIPSLESICDLLAYLGLDERLII